MYMSFQYGAYRGLDDALAAHDGPTLQQTRSRCFGTIVRDTGQLIFKRRSSGRDINAKQSYDKTVHATLPPSSNFTRRRIGEKKNVCSRRTSGYELLCSCFGFEQLSFLALFKIYLTSKKKKKSFWGVSV